MKKGYFPQVPVVAALCHTLLHSQCPPPPTQGLISACATSPGSY